MAEQEQIDHATFREQIAAALAGGLTTAEQLRFDAHAAACEACAAELASARETEKQMNALFVPPAAGLEDRIIDRLRFAGTRRFTLPRVNFVVHPAVRKAAVGIAAAIVLAGAGFVVNEAVERAATPSNRVKVASNLRQIGPAPLYSNPRTEAQGLGFKLNNAIDAEHAIAADVNLGVNRGNLGFNGGKLDTGGKPIVRYSYADSYDANDSIALPSDQQTNAPRAGVTLNFDTAAGEATRKPRQTDADGDGTRNGVNFYAATPKEAKTGAGTSGVSGLSINGIVTPTPAQKDAKAYRGVEDAGGERQKGWFKPTDLALVTEKSDAEKLADAPAAVAAPSAAPAMQPAAQLGDEAKLTRAAPVMTSPPPAAVAQVTQGQAAPATGNPPAEAPEHVAPAPSTRKVIRNGQMEFEVDRFDAAFAQVSKLTQENGGYVGTTDSEKLPNAKVKGTVTVRVPPDRLDTLVLQLRGIGDLKSQKLEAQDISKHYSDLDSELRAAKAMEERLLNIIKEGKGQIKDLLAAEKELGNWRQKVEQITGEMRYYDNQVALSTLNITLFERDIRTPATAQETETIDAGVESADVEKARADALKAIEEAKGRVIQSDLKRYDAGQFGATIVAEIPPDASGPLLDRIRQIGKVARLDIQRRQKADENAQSTATNAPVRVEKKDTRLNLSLYNLANVAPRVTSTMNVASDDVEAAYRTILDRVTKAGGRIVSSNLARNKPEQTSGTISFEVPSEQSDAVMTDLRKLGEVMKLSLAENPDVQNVTTAKRGFNVALISSAAVAPRETTTMSVASADVGAAREKILSAASEGGARVLTSQLNENDRTNPNATLEIDVPRAGLAKVEKSLADAGDTISRVVSRSADTENTIDSKVKLQLTLVPAEKLPPREQTAMTVELSDVESAIANLQLAAQDAGGRVTDSNLSKEHDGTTTGQLTVEVPLAKSQQVIDQAKKLGTVRAVQATRNQQVPAGSLAKAKIVATFTTADAIVEPGHGVLATIRNGLSTSVAGLLWSLQLIVIGLCFVLPWIAILWGGWRLLKRRSSSASGTGASPVSS